jgi:HAMP domain-containing protein
VIAAYGLALGAVAAYAIWLSRERRSLRRALSRGKESNRG